MDLHEAKSVEVERAYLQTRYGVLLEYGSVSGNWKTRSEIEWKLESGSGITRTLEAIITGHRWQRRV